MHNHLNDIAYTSLLKHIIHIYHLSSLILSHGPCHAAGIPPWGIVPITEKEQYTLIPQATSAVVPAGTITRVATVHIVASLALIQC